MRIVPRFELRKKDHVTDAFLAEEHDTKAVDSYADPAGRGHAVFKSYQKIFIKFLLLTASLLLEAFALLNGIVLLSVRWGDFLTVDATFKHLHTIGFVRRELGKRHELHWEMCHKSRLNERGFAKFFENQFQTTNL